MDRVNFLLVSHFSSFIRPKNKKNVFIYWLSFEFMDYIFEYVTVCCKNIEFILRENVDK